MRAKEKEVFISWLECNLYSYGSVFDSVVEELIKKLDALVPENDFKVGDHVVFSLKGNSYIGKISGLDSHERAIGFLYNRTKDVLLPNVVTFFLKDARRATCREILTYEEVRQWRSS